MTMMKNEDCRVSEKAEDLIDLYFPVLNSGFIALKDYLGNDSAIERAARVSYGKGTRKVSETRDLIRYLLRHKHTSPFEQCELVFHMRLPMDVNRQHVRHRTASLNEYSTRYSEAIDLCETTLPDEWRLQSKDNKQGSKGNITEWPQGWRTGWGVYAEEYKQFIVQNEEGQIVGVYGEEITPGDYLTERESKTLFTAREIYEERLKFGMAKEQARKDLPLSTATEMYWKSDLHNLMHYLKLRLHAHAQKEIREYAKVMAGIVKELFPLTWEAFEDYTLNSDSFSYNEMNMLSEIMSDSNIGVPEQKDYPELYKKFNLSKRENDEFWAKLSRPEKMDYTIDKSKGKQHDDFKV